MLPADEPAVIRYLVRFADTLNPRTVALRLTALSQWHAHLAPALHSTLVHSIPFLGLFLAILSYSQMPLGEMVMN